MLPDSLPISFHDGELLFDLQPCQDIGSLLQYPVGIDWLSFSFATDLDLFSLSLKISEFLAPYGLLLNPVSSKSVLPFYDATYHILPQFGGKSHGHLSVRRSEPLSYYLSFSGSAFALMSQDATNIFNCFFRSEHLRSIRIHRVDVCLDDYLNQLGLFDLIPTAYEQGLFSVTRAPAFQRISHNDLTGDTIYVGKRSSHKMIRCYQKGRQMGDSASSWVRFEVEFRNSESIYLPLDIIIRPRDYLFSAYYAFFASLFGNGISSVDFPKVFHHSQDVSFEIKFKKSFNFVRTQCGHYIYAFRTILHGLGYTDTDVLDFLSRLANNTGNGFPKVFEPYFIFGSHHQFDGVILNFFEHLNNLDS